MKRIVMALVVFVVVSLILGMLGLGTVATLGAIIAAVIYLLMARGGASGDSANAGFQPDFRHDNIAINSATGQLWTRGTDGKSAVMTKEDVLRWTLANTSYGDHATNNRIELHVRDLNRPMVTVRFNRHGDGWKWNARRNQAEAEEWQSRLTTWLHT